jgi:hypothetical protein
MIQNSIKHFGDFMSWNVVINDTNSNKRIKEVPFFMNLYVCVQIMPWRLHYATIIIIIILTHRINHLKYLYTI